MKHTMRLFQRKRWYHVEFYRGKSKALKTRDEKEANALFKEMEREYIRGRLINLESLKKCTLSEFQTLYLDTRSGHSTETSRKDKISLTALREALGDMQLKTVTTGKVEDFKRKTLQRGVKAESVNGYLRHIKAALSYALEEGYIEKKPKIKMCATGKRLPRINSPEDLNKILEKAKEVDADLWRLLTFYLWTGCRRNEGLKLSWQDCRFWTERNAQGEDEIGGECKVTGKGQHERIVPLLQPVIDALYPIRKDIGRVFPEWHPDTVTHKFIEVARSCGVKIRLHDLRHNAVSYMLRSGIPIEVVQKIVGHSQLSTTLIYTHILSDVEQREMKKFRFE